jgi:tetratricopeptide (TPR) repeat protein
MTIPRFPLVIALVSLLSVFAGCIKHQPTSLDEALSLYRENKLEQALPLFRQLVAEDSDNAEKYVWLAETYRRLDKKEDAVKSARRALELNPRSSFAHTVVAEASNPVMGDWAQANSDSTWFHVMKAVDCDSTDGNPWLLVWGEAIHRGEPPMMRKALRRLVETGFLTKAALAYGRWMLRALPEKAILLTNGDMDTYPPCAVQEVEGFRRDIVIVNRGTLNTKWYARFIRGYAGVPLPVDDAQLQHLEAYKDQQGKLVTPSDQIFRG